MNCIIVDDEPMARKGLSEYVSEIEDLVLVGQYENALQAGKALSGNAIDLIFLDIQMPKLNGLDFLKSLRQKPMVILTTAYTDHALQAYELDVLDYLIKPIRFERFLKACDKAREFHSLKTGVMRQDNEPRGYFFVRCYSGYEKVEYSELLFAESMENYVVLHTRSGKLVTYLTLKALEGYLSATDFIKVHKSYIIAVDKIDRIAGNEIKILTHSIPISRSLKDEVMMKLMKDKLLTRGK